MTNQEQAITVRTKIEGSDTGTNKSHVNQITSKTKQTEATITDPYGSIQHQKIKNNRGNKSGIGLLNGKSNTDRNIILPQRFHEPNTSAKETDRQHSQQNQNQQQGLC